MGTRQQEPSDVIVIGGGVIGLACAHALAERGRSVRVLERRTVGCGASHGNCGLITPSHALPLNKPGLIREVLRMMGRADSPVFVRLRFDLAFLAWGARFLASCSPARVLAILHARAALLDASRALYVELIEREGLECEWEELGLLEVFATAETLEAARGHDHGVPADWLARDELLAREPALLESVHGGRFFPGDAQLRPDALVRELARVVRSRGVRIDEDCEVQGFNTGGACLESVVTSQGKLQATDVLVATGAWSPQLGQALRVRIPVQPGKGYSITYTRPDPCPRHPLLLAEANMAVTPWASGYRLGGTMELSGYDDSLNRARLDALRRGAARYLRRPEGDSPDEWCGWRPMTPDELPILGRVPGLANAYLATGHGMMGVSMAPATARLIAELMTGDAPFVDPAPYTIGRFG